MRLLFIMLMPVFCFSQNKCSCYQVVEEVIEKVEANYVDRENLKKNNFFRWVKSRKPHKNLYEFDDKCYRLVYDLFASFRDKHLTYKFVFDSGRLINYVYDSISISSRYAFLINNYQKSTTTIEGVWENEGAEQTYLIEKNSNKNYRVIVWNSKNPSLKKGQLKGYIDILSKNKFLYTNYTGGNSILLVELTKQGDKLFSLNTGFWRKFDSANIPTKRPKLQPELIQISDSIVLFRLPYFDPFYKKMIDTLLKANRNILSATKYLILDLTINYGGNTGTYQELIPWLYTKPIRIESGLYYSSQTNVKMQRENFLARTDSGSKSWLSNKDFLSRMMNNLGKLVVDTGFFIKYDSIYSNPAKVFVLTGQRCLSTGELFLITAVQSEKVTIVGQNTYGSIDRADAYEFTMACSNFKMTIPVAMRKKEVYLKAIDVNGFEPQIRLKQDEDPLSFVLKLIQTK